MSLYLPYIVLILNLHHYITVSATTSIIGFFTDDACHDRFATVYTDTDAGNGQCGIINGTNSVNLTTLDPECTVTVYSDLYCTYHKIPVLLGACGSQSINSYSVDCPALNGTHADSYTTSWASSSETSSQVRPSSISIPLSSSSQQQSFTQPTTPYTLTSPPSTQAGTPTPTDPRTALSTAAPSPQTATSSSTDLYYTSSVPSSSTITSSLPTNPSQPSGNNRTDRNIEIILLIVFGVGIPLLVVCFRKRITAIVDKVLKAIVDVIRKKNLHNLVAQTGNTVSGVERPDAQRPDPADTTDFWRNLERQLSDSDLVQLNDGFSSSRYRLPNLRDRRRSHGRL